MKFLKYIPNGIENLMLINTIYHRACADNDYTDALDIIYKDIKTQKKYKETIEKPPIYAYLVKPEYRDYKYNREFMEVDKCDIHKVPYKDLPFWIAKQAGPEYVNQAKYLRQVNYGAIKNFHKFPYVFGTDVDIRSFYMTHWRLEYDNDNINARLNYGCADIETDAIKCNHFAREGEVPILCATFIDVHERKSYTVYLRAKDNMEQILKFEADIDGFVDELHELFDDVYGKFEYNIYAYDDEREMIRDYFRFKNNSSCDIIMYWNGNDFDMPFLNARMIKLGMDPKEVVCHPDFKYKEFYCKKDHKNFQLVNKRDWVTSSTYYQTIDQMLLYCASRKGVKTLRSAKLNVIAREEIKDEKLNYEEENNIMEFPYKNFRKYLLYNIKDVLLQIGIEEKIEDLQGYYVRGYRSCAPYDHVFAQTKFLTSRQYHDYLSMTPSLVPGNNCNITYGQVADENKEEIRYDGAIVGDPELMGVGEDNINGLPILGKPSKYIYKFVVDFDYTALYPNTLIAHNISSTTLIAKLFINESVEDLAKKINRATEDAYKQRSEEDVEDKDDDMVVDISDLDDQGMHFLDDYQTGNILNVGAKWFNLPTTTELCELINKELGITNENKTIEDQMIMNEKIYRIG